MPQNSQSSPAALAPPRRRRANVSCPMHIDKRCPAEGRAVLNLDTQDFGNFLVHPLMATADLPSGMFEFRREGTVLEVATGRATFTGVWHGQPVVMEACQPDRCVGVIIFPIIGVLCW